VESILKTPMYKIAVYLIESGKGAYLFKITFPLSHTWLANFKKHTTTSHVQDMDKL
jgi:hypothetical protein